MQIVITGGTGLIGRALCAYLLPAGYDIIVLSRNPNAVQDMPDAVQLVRWDASSGDGWLQYVEGADAIINLAGENLADGLWTDAKKQRIYASRIDAGKAVVDAISRVKQKPQMVIQASGIDYYGNRGDEVITEDSKAGHSFLANLCVDWEASTVAVEEMGVKRAIVRTGIVLTTQGGALPRLLLPFRLFAGGPMGSGRQYWPWIHMNDEVRAMQFILENLAEGPFNLTAPNPLTNREFARVLGNVMGRPALLPAPAFALKLVLGQMATVVLDGRKALPARLLDRGFEFDFATADTALQDLLG